MKNKNQRGFSLIELLVVIAIIGVITGITSDIFIQIIKASNKGNIITEVKQNGDSVLNKIERTLRNAEEISSYGYKDSLGWHWTDLAAFGSVENCTVPAVPSDRTTPVTGGICAIIVKNPPSVGGYTKIQFNTERDLECSSSPFTSADQSLDASNRTYCSGNIRIVDDYTSSDQLTALKTTSSVGQIITNTEKRSGVSVRPTGTNAIISIKSATGKPPLVTIKYTLVQGIDASSRVDSLAEVPFELVISLRSY